jgi:hypothetical protein
MSEVFRFEQTTQRAHVSFLKIRNVEEGGEIVAEDCPFKGGGRSLSLKCTGR